MILIDTHIIVWLAFGPNKLSAKAASAIETERLGNSGLAICAMSLYELSLLTRRGRLQLNISPETLLSAVEKGFIVKPITAQIAAASTTFPDPYPRDPMDRLIGATALVEGIPLITADERIRKANVIQTIW